MIVQSFWCVLVFLAPSYNLTLQTFQMSGHKCSKSEVSYKTFLKYIIDSLKRFPPNKGLRAQKVSSKMVENTNEPRALHSL